MISKYDNVIAAKEQTIKILLISLAVVAVFAAIMGLGWLRAPSDIRIHVPPDLSGGAIVGANEVSKANVYAFTYYIWQQMYRWERNGYDDYALKINALQNYMTPFCLQDRTDDLELRRSRRELDRRRRAVWEIPGRGYAPERVHIEASGVWTVFLDLYISETMMGETVKERFVNYPIRVVRYNIDPEKNPWGLALDCLADTPTVIQMKNEEEE